MKKRSSNVGTSNGEAVAMARVPEQVTPPQKSVGNGHVDPQTVDFVIILEALQAMRNGDFSVRLPTTWTRLPGKVADTFNEIASANQQMSRELKRIGQAVGKEGRTRERIRFNE